MGLERDIERIDAAQTLEDIRHVVREYSARSPVSSSALYSGRVGKASAHDIAVDLAERDKLAIIDDTPRARFLASGQVDEAIRKSARRLFEVNGADPESARKLVNDFLYGDAKAPLNSPTSIQNCLWCEASRDFAQSLRGDVKVIAVNANPYRVFGQVEIPTALQYSNARASVGVYT